jgi:hypothetical protein
MTIRGKLVAHASQLASDAASAAVDRVRQAGARYRGLRSVFEEESVPITIENLLAGLIAAVKVDEHEEDRSARDVFTTARSRRRRLGLLSFGAGPLVGVATHVVDLYCDTAIVCDLADLHSLELTERQIGAHMLTLWGIMESLEEAEAVMAGTSALSLMSIISRDIRADVAGRAPDKLSKRAAIQLLAGARDVVGDAREAVGAGSAGGIVFSGHKTKQLIKRAELEFGIRGNPNQRRSMSA